MIIIASLLGLSLGAWAQESITPAQAKDHVGQKVTVCGTVASASYLEKGKNSPTLLNLDVAYPKNIFTVVIYGKDRAKFGKPEADLLKKNICVTGTVGTYKNVPQINVQTPDQLKVADKKPAPAQPKKKPAAKKA